MPTIKGFNYVKDEEGNATMTDGEGNPVDLKMTELIGLKEVKEKPEKPEKTEGITKLLKKPRDELNAIAEEKGLDTSEYHTKKEVATAILGSE